MMKTTTKLTTTSSTFASLARGTSGTSSRCAKKVQLKARTKSDIFSSQRYETGQREYTKHFAAVLGGKARTENGRFLEMHIETLQSLLIRPSAEFHDCFTTLHQYYTGVEQWITLSVLVTLFVQNCEANETICRFLIKYCTIECNVHSIRTRQLTRDYSIGTVRFCRIAHRNRPEIIHEKNLRESFKELFRYYRNSHYWKRLVGNEELNEKALMTLAQLSTCSPI